MVEALEHRLGVFGVQHQRALGEVVALDPPVERSAQPVRVAALVEPQLEMAAGDPRVGAEQTVHSGGKDRGRVVAGQLGTAQLDVGADLAMSRHLPDGTLDTSFGAGGRVTVDFYGGFDSGFDVSLQPTDGRLVAVGSALNVFSVENAVIRLQEGSI